LKFSPLERGIFRKYSPLQLDWGGFNSHFQLEIIGRFFPIEWSKGTLLGQNLPEKLQLFQLSLEEGEESGEKLLER
jgi:hypothetical protein